MSDIQFSPAYIAANPSPVNPQSNRHNKIKNLLNKINTLFSEKTSQLSDYVNNSSDNSKSKGMPQLNLNKYKRYFKKSYALPLVIFIAAVIGVYLLSKTVSGNSNTLLNDADQRISIKKAKATQVVNKEFLFPLKDDKGKEVSRIKYYIQDVQLQDEIVVKGQRASAVKGRTFLIVYLKITNDYTSDISLKSRDYVRLMVNSNAEKLAPDIHNDPVEIQAISTKYTRLGFPINDSDTNLMLQVGEINGNKQNIKLDKLQ